MSNHTIAYASYTDAIQALPEEAFLGSLLFFSISRADVNLEQARQELTDRGLSTTTLRSQLRPVDAFRKATKEFAKKFREEGDIRSELLVRPVGEDGEQAHRHLILERADFRSGKRRRIVYEKVGEVIFNRGAKRKGEYTGHSVESHKVSTLMSPLKPEEEVWLDHKLADFPDRYDHLLNHMDSHAVRTFVREYIYRLGGVCVKESGGLYFVRQEHVDEVNRLAEWVNRIGSEFHTLPLLNLTDQRQMILEALEDETVAEVERLMDEVKRILEDPERKIEEKTYDGYIERVFELRDKIKTYSDMLGDRATGADLKIDIFHQQVNNLNSRVRIPQTKAKVLSSGQQSS